MSCRKLEVRGLTIETAGTPSRRPPRRLVDGLNLSIGGGESLALVGESGAGKSMTCLAILDLLPKGIRRISGNVFVNDHDVYAMEREKKRLLRCGAIGVIMQNPMSAFDPVFTVFSHFADTMKAGNGGVAGAENISSRQIRRRAMEAVKEVGLDGSVLDAYPFQLSGGMLQRIMIALALVNDPEYLIADEPTTDLDVVSQKMILDLIRERCFARHLGLLLVTHDLSVAARMADSVTIMHRGKAVEAGPVREVFDRPEHAYTRELVAAHKRLYGERFARLAHAAETTETAIATGVAEAIDTTASTQSNL